MNKLTIVLTGKKQSGKSTMCNYIRARYLNLRWDKDNEARGFAQRNRFHYVDDGGLLRIKDGDGDFAEGVDYTLHPAHSANVKVYSFADPLKDFCINVLGVPHESCWGTDIQKNTPVPHLLWENLATEYRAIDNNNYDSTAGEDYVNPPSFRTGAMTGREVMQVFGTDICRRMYGDCWARGTYNKIKSEGFELALVADARFPNEITIGTEVKAKTVRLGRNVSNDQHKSEIALDDFPKDQYTLFVDNSNYTLQEQCKLADPYIDEWFAKAGII